MKRIVLIGPGRVGQAAARLLMESGYGIAAVIGRDLARARSAARFIGCPGAESTDLARARDGEIVLIALPDDRLAAMAETLRSGPFLKDGATLVHFSGLHDASILLGEERQGFTALALHPLQSLADAVIAVRSLPGSPFTIEGSPDALPLGEELVRAMDGIPHRISAEKKPLYHTAACVASNYLVTLVDIARQIMAACGFDNDEALTLLTPLLKETGKNVSTLGPEKALTGPIARGDIETVSRHLAAMSGLPPHLREIYSLMGKETVALALRKGTLSPEIAGELRKLLE